MSRWRKKPVVIEAEQFDGSEECAARLKLDRGALYEDGVTRGYLYIETLEGDHQVSPGDWVITGVKGERYPCKPDIFALTYERADDVVEGGAS